MKKYIDPIHNSKLDGKISNQNTDEINSSVVDISDDFAIYQAQVTSLDFCDTNTWLITLFGTLLLCVRCGRIEINTTNISTSVVFRLQRECKAFTENTRVHEKR